MSRNDLIRMAREAGFAYSWSAAAGEALERFAAIVAAAERDRIADEAKHIIKRAEDRGAAVEREACAKEADKWVGQEKLAAAIRARGEK